MNIALLLQMAADADSQRIAVVCNNKSWSYGQILSATRGAAALLSESKCTHIALLDESSEAAPIALFGAALAGIPYVPLNYRLADEDLAALLSRIAPACVIGDVERTLRLDPTGGHACFQRDEFVVAANAVGETSAVEEQDGEEIAAQIFTSGTTATPKAALLRHANLLGYILGTVEFCSAREEDAQLVCVPPYHIAGISALLSSIYAMRRIIMLPAFNPDDWLSLAARHKVSNAFLVPTMLSRIVDRLEVEPEIDLSSLKAIAYGGGRMPLELIDRALDLFPETSFTNAYGLTETSSTIALLGPEEHRLAHNSDNPVVRARLGSVGRPLPTVEIEIRNEAGYPVPSGEHGEICVRGDQVSGEYRERSALDAEGWFPTRDTGWLDSEGYLFLAGRADDVIVRGGENISPGEIEEVLATHPAVAEAVAVGIPSAEWGESAAVAIVTRPGHEQPDEETVKQLIRKRLRSSRVPEQVIFVKELPYNEMGKLLRRQVRELFSPGD